MKTRRCYIVRSVVVVLAIFIGMTTWARNVQAEELMNGDDRAELAAVFTNMRKMFEVSSEVGSTTVVSDSGTSVIHSHLVRDGNRSAIRYKTFKVGEDGTERSFESGVDEIQTLWLGDRGFVIQKQAVSNGHDDYVSYTKRASWGKNRPRASLFVGGGVDGMVPGSDMREMDEAIISAKRVFVSGRGDVAGTACDIVTIDEKDNGLIDVYLDSPDRRTVRRIVVRLDEHDKWHGTPVDNIRWPDNVNTPVLESVVEDVVFTDFREVNGKSLPMKVTKFRTLRRRDGVELAFTIDYVRKSVKWELDEHDSALFIPDIQKGSQIRYLEFPEQRLIWDGREIVEVPDPIAP